MQQQIFTKIIGNPCDIRNRFLKCFTDGSTGGAGGVRRVVTGAGDVMDQQKEKSLTMDELYGEGKPYPEPYNAGR